MAKATLEDVIRVMNQNLDPNYKLQCIADLLFPTVVDEPAPAPKPRAAKVVVPDVV